MNQHGELINLNNISAAVLPPVIALEATFLHDYTLPIIWLLNPVQIRLIQIINGPISVKILTFLFAAMTTYWVQQRAAILDIRPKK